jgi:hypothetical protein
MLLCYYVIVLYVMNVTVSISIGLYTKLDLWTVNKLYYIIYVDCACLHFLTRCVDIIVLLFSHMLLWYLELPSFWNAHTLSTAVIRVSGQIG